MSNSFHQENQSAFKRKKILFLRGFQLRYAFLVAGSLVLILGFSVLHMIFVSKSNLPFDQFVAFLPALRASTWRLFSVGLVFTFVMTMAAIFISHRAVGPLQRLEDEIRQHLDSDTPVGQFKVREGDDLEDLISLLNKLISKIHSR